ncbi:MAG: Pr6Pr family membrane protein [Thermoleophilia bacterium]|nr:Pr6Pr family membrane protein [Thermoleophilia bacterium]
MNSSPIRNRRIQIFHATLLALALAGVVLGAIDTIRDPDPASAAVRFERFFSYFTILSNLLVAVVSGVLTRRPAIDTAFWRVVRVIALMSIVITGLIFFVVLRPDADLHGTREIVGNALRHYVVPLLAVVGWAAFGPWPAQAWRDLAKVMTWPLAFGAFTLVHGAVTGWYPYDFLDVGERGYGSVAVQLLITSAEMALIAALIVGLNRRWSRTRASGMQIAGTGASPTKPACRTSP